MQIYKNEGMSPEIQQALQRRQQGGAPTPQLSQVSPQAPSAQGSQPMNPSDMGQPQMPQQAQGQAGATQAPGAVSDPEIQLIIKALADRLKMKSKVEDRATEGGMPANHGQPKY